MATNESAWPISDHTTCIPNEGCRVQPGLTLRDYFAGQALAGLLSQPEALTVPLGTSVAEWYATTAYDYAAAMLAERERSR